MDEEEADQVEQSLDELSKAFAEAMGRNQPPSDKHLEETSNDDAAADPNAAQAAQQKLKTDEFDTNKREAEQFKAEPLLDEPVQEDHCPISPQTILEAILFVGHPENEPVTSKSVAKLLRGVEPGEVDDLVVTLNEEYESLGYPLRIASVDAGYRIELDDDFEHVRERFYGRVRQARLSQSAVDVLAVVAYHQPITREAVDKTLGSGNSGRILNQLIRRELICQQVTGEKPKRKEYVTTDRFLSLFNLANLDDLPRNEDPQ